MSQLPSQRVPHTVHITRPPRIEGNPMQPCHGNLPVEFGVGHIDLKGSTQLGPVDRTRAVPPLLRQTRHVGETEMGSPCSMPRKCPLLSAGPVSTSGGTNPPSSVSPAASASRPSLGPLGPRPKLGTLRCQAPPSGATDRFLGYTRKGIIRTRCCSLAVIHRETVLC